MAGRRGGRRVGPALLQRSAQVSNADFLTQQFWFEDGGVAYMGLQEGGDGHRQVRFSVWNAPARRRRPLR